MASPLTLLPGARPDPLEALRDIHLPPAPAWWPPAPGWWLACLVILLALVFLARAVLRRRRAARPRRAALTACMAIRRRHHDGAPPAALVADITLLLRRVAMTRWPRERVAGVTGHDWLAFLDANSAYPGFVHGPGRVLATAAYRPAESVDMDALLTLAEQWVRHNT